MITCFAVAAALIFALMLGMLAAFGGVPAGDDLVAAGGVFLVLPCLLLAAQGPLWLFRALAGRRIRNARERWPSDRPQKAQFGVAQLMWATALVAVCVALARGGLALWAPPGGEEVARMWSRLAVAGVVAAIGSAAIGIPSTAAVLIARRPAVWLLPMAMLAVMLTIAVLALITAVFGNPPSLEDELLFGLFALSTFGGVLAGLAVIRACGFTMARQ
jgi:hypothetical protein